MKPSYEIMPNEEIKKKRVLSLRIPVLDTSAAKNVIK